MPMSDKPRFLSAAFVAAMAAAAMVALATATTAHGQSSQRLINRLQLQRSVDDLSRSARQTERSIAEAERRIEQRTLRNAERLRLQGELDLLRRGSGLQRHP